MSRSLLVLFAGGGLADVGAHAAGYRTVAAVEWDADIAACYSAAHPGVPIHVDPVQAVDYRPYAGVDAAWASPSCKNASQANQDAGEAPEDLEAAVGIRRCLWETRPERFVLENVWNYRMFTAFRSILEVLHALGYRFHYEHVCAADHGVPQTRKRLILRAVRSGTLPPLTATHCEGGASGGLFADEGLLSWVGWYAAIEDLLPGLPESALAAWQIARLPEWLTTCLVTNQYDQNFDRADRAPVQVPPEVPAPPVLASVSGGRMHAVLVDGQNVTGTGREGPACIRHADEPALTVSASSGAKGLPRAWIPPGRVVRITPRCLARFQSVPDDYVLPEKAALACRVVGNAVPCLLAQRIMESFE